MVYVRPITLKEGNQLQNTVRRGKDATKLRRAQIILASTQGMNVPDIARLYHCSEEHVRAVIRQFNLDGLDSLPRKKGGGRPPVITEEEKSMIVELALMPPGIMGYPFTSWSLRKLAQAVIDKGIVKEISQEKVREILKENKVSYQRTKTWKESNDPDFDAKKNE